MPASSPRRSLRWAWISSPGPERKTAAGAKFALPSSTSTARDVYKRQILNGAAAALTEAGANLAGFSQSAAKSAAAETLDADLVIVGAGAAGTMAALEAMDAGLNVVILEKCGKAVSYTHLVGEGASSGGVQAARETAIQAVSRAAKARFECLLFISWGCLLLLSRRGLSAASRRA